MGSIRLGKKAKPLSVDPRKKSKVWSHRFLSVLIVLFLSISTICAAGQFTGAQADSFISLPPGQLFDIGGYKLHLYCTGPQNTGNPTVILETMAGGTSVDWAWIQPEVAKVTQVCSYDRAGRGWSSPSPHPITLKNMVSDLHRLLQKAGVAGPYVLVGHSIGGIYVRQYVADYPGEVAGMVLLDSSHPDQLMRIPEFQTGLRKESRMDAVLTVLARFGAWRFIVPILGKLNFGDLPPQQYAQLAAFWSSPFYLESMHAEVAAEPTIFADAHTLGNLGRLPLMVITRGDHPPAYWVELQNELAGLSSDGLHITVPGATHTSLVFRPEHAYVVSQAILQVVEAARTGQRLAIK